MKRNQANSLKQTSYRKAIIKDAKSMKPASISISMDTYTIPLTESEIRQGIRIKKENKNETSVKAIQAANETISELEMDVKDLAIDNDNLLTKIEDLQSEAVYMQNAMTDIFDNSQSTDMLCEKIVKLIHSNISTSNNLMDALHNFMSKIKEGNTITSTETSTLNNETAHKNGLFTNQEWEVMQNSRSQAPEPDGIKITSFNIDDYSDTVIAPREDREIKMLVTDGALLTQIQESVKNNDISQAILATSGLRNMSVQPPISYVILQILDTSELYIANDANPMNLFKSLSDWLREIDEEGMSMQQMKQLQTDAAALRVSALKIFKPNDYELKIQAVNERLNKALNW